jgi:hypothetical protein
MSSETIDPIDLLREYFTSASTKQIGLKDTLLIFTDL